MLNPKPDSIVLELGMGNGFFTKDLMAICNNLEYIGLDYSQTMVDEARRLNQELISSQKVSFIYGSLESLPFKDNSIDCLSTQRING